MWFPRLPHARHHSARAAASSVVTNGLGRAESSLNAYTYVLIKVGLYRRDASFCVTQRLTPAAAVVVSFVLVACIQVGAVQRRYASCPSVGGKNSVQNSVLTTHLRSQRHRGFAVGFFFSWCFCGKTRSNYCLLWVPQRLSLFALLPCTRKPLSLCIRALGIRRIRGMYSYVSGFSYAKDARCQALNRNPRGNYLLQSSILLASLLYRYTRVKP